jgi:two-component system chemotaxis sensor kinase CheA
MTSENTELEYYKELYSLVFEKSSSGVLMIDTSNGKFVECNDRIVEMLKLESKKDVLNLHPSQLSPEFQPDGRRSDEKADEMIGIAMARGTHSFEWKHIRANGEEFWAEIILTKITVDSTDMVYVTWKDVEDKKRAEAQLERNLKILAQTNRELEEGKRELQELNESLEDKVREKTAKVTTLLNNAGQGFLIFDKDFVIDDEYSRECEKYLGKDLAHQDIAKILFPDTSKADFFKSNILDMLNIEEEVKQKAILSLMPNELILNRRALKLEYKILKDSRIMLIITNISAKKKLEKRVKKEQDILKMIVTIIGDSDIFYDVKNDFEYFIKHPTEYVHMKKTSLFNINTLYRIIHTFKGAFLQLFMNDTATHLHDIESKLSEFLVDDISVSNDDIVMFLNETISSSLMENDLNNIKELLGQKFLSKDSFLSIDKHIIENIETKYIALLRHNHIESDVSNCLLNEIQCLSRKSLKSQLNSYPRLTLQIAQRLQKEVYEFAIIGDENILLPESYKPFIKSLIHLFRNSVDHGIETPEKRTELDKDEVGTISCTFNNSNDKLQIIISDDGAGIDIEKIKAQISDKIDTENLKDEEIFMYIFKDNFSTKNEVTETSGRGFGMSAVKLELEKLNGIVKIQSELNIGTTFVFEIEI